MPPVNAVLAVDSMMCIQPTDGHESRDEVYFRIHGNSSHGLFSGRLPDEGDYFEFKADQTNSQNEHWTNYDQAPIGRPVLWAGRLEEGQGAEVVVFIAEQDNRQLGQLKDIADKALDFLKASGVVGTSPLATAALEGADQLVEMIPDIRTHGIIGIFSVHLRNVPGGQMEFAFLPWTNWQYDLMLPGYTPGETTLPHKNSYYEAALDSSRAVHLDLKAPDKGLYQAVITLSPVPEFHELELLKFIGSRIDRCRDENGGQRRVRVMNKPGTGSPGFEEIPWNARLVRFVPIDVGLSGGTTQLKWLCGENEENNFETRPDLPPGTEVIYASRFPHDDGKITWACYKTRTPAPQEIGQSRANLQSGLTPAPPAEPPPVLQMTFHGMNGEEFVWEAADGGRPWPFGSIEVQDGWRWCNKCQGLWFSLNANSRCPSGGTHSQDGSGHYAVPHNVPASVPAEGLSRSWRHCRKCQGLWNTDWPGPSRCPAGGEHSSEGSGDYATFVRNPPLGSRNGSLQAGWHWCKNCRGLWYAGNPTNGRCPAVDVVLPGHAEGAGHVRQEGNGAELLHRSS